MEVLVVGNTAYVDDDFCAKAFPGDHVKVVAAAEARRDESSPMPRGKSFCNTWIRPTSSTAWSTYPITLPRIPISWAISSYYVRSFARARVAGSSCCM